MKILLTCLQTKKTRKEVFIYSLLNGSSGQNYNVYSYIHIKQHFELQSEFSIYKCALLSNKYQAMCEQKKMVSLLSSAFEFLLHSDTQRSMDMNEKILLTYEASQVDKWQ